MKKTIKILLIAFLFFVYIYFSKISSIPGKKILFEGDKLNFGNFLGLSVEIDSNNYSSVLASTNLENSIQPKSGNITAKVKLFDIFTVKNVDISVIKKTKVIPVGQVVGLKLYTHGVLVVGLSEIVSDDNERIKPYEGTDIQEGDNIIELNGLDIIDTEDLINKINGFKGEKVTLKYLREGKEFNCDIQPIKTKQGSYKLGLWVRDSAAGIGTLSYYNPENKTFAALGHGITDIDTGELVNISEGEFMTTKILSIVKGEKGRPGKIQGSLDNQKNIGKIYKNSNLGIYGELENIEAISNSPMKEMEVADRSEIELGKANILCSLDGEKVKQYEIEIEKMFIQNNDDNKSMLIKVTDEELLNKTGGIVQGMSGSPILQNGKFIGAVTNVLVNDPASGYAIFGDLMINEAK